MKLSLHYQYVVYLSGLNISFGDYFCKLIGMQVTLHMGVANGLIVQAYGTS